MGEDLDARLDTDDKGDGDKELDEADDATIDSAKLEVLKRILNVGAPEQVPLPAKSGEKRGSSHLDGSVCSDSSAEDLDVRDNWSRKKGSTPVKAASNTGQWTEEDLDVVCQICYKTDLDRFQTYHRNKLMPADRNTINTNDHSGYIKVARVDASTVIENSVFSVGTYRAVLRLRGGDVSKFDKEVEAAFKKSAKRVTGTRH